jgi:peptide methionine sulfoxide reductase MsrA
MNYLNERDFQEYQEHLEIVATHLKTAHSFLIAEATHQNVLNNPTYAWRMKRMALAIDAIILANNLKDM